MFSAIVQTCKDDKVCSIGVCIFSFYKKALRKAGYTQKAGGND